jgi:RHS repeat-associated protein
LEPSYGYDSHGQGNMFTTQTGSLQALDSETPQSESWFLSSHGRVNNQITGWSYDSTGNLLQVGGMARTFTYDAENRQTSAVIGTNQSTYAYDGSGRRVQSTAWNQTTTYVYDAMGNVAEEIGPATDPALIYTTVDALGSTRLTTTANGGLYLNYDYLPFGREIGAGYGGRDSSFSPGAYPSDPSGPGPRSKFTAHPRDSESGLDYFGARYFPGAQGRFTSPDPSMLSTVLANPQSWNRYSYALNNPLRYVDPNGELWVASGDATNPYSWVDKCGENQTCYESVAAVVGQNLRVYGSENAQAITNYAANANGLINVVTLADNADANFGSIQTAGREENYLGLSQAAALFNVAVAYGQKYPDDEALVFTGGSTATGGSALDANGQPIHRSHRNGANVDLRYMGDDGTSLTGRTAAANGNVERNEYIMSQFAGQNANLGATLTGDPARYGLGPIPAGLQQVHQNHMHFQQNYPAPPRPAARIRPGQR